MGKRLSSASCRAFWGFSGHRPGWGWREGRLPHLPPIELKDLADVLAGFGKGWNSLIVPYGRRARIVGSQYQQEVPVKLGHQMLKIFDPCFDVFLGIEKRP